MNIKSIVKSIFPGKRNGIELNSNITYIVSEIFRKEYWSAEQIKLDLSEYVSGVYLISLQYGEKLVVKKLILDRK